MPIVNLQKSVKLNEEGALNTGDPSLIASGGTVYVDLALELSKLYGRNIRQGNTFYVSSVQIAMRPVGSGYDSGLAHTTRGQYIPATKHVKSAWQSGFRTWRRQNRLYAGATGSKTRFDDFELAYDASNLNSRTSKIYQSGVADTSADSCVLIGSSSSSIFSLEDYYESLNPPALPSRYSWNNTVIKDAKFDSKFPVAREFFVTGNMSTVVTDDTENALSNLIVIGDGTNMLSGASSTAPLYKPPEWMNVMCGLMKFESYVIADDTSVQAPDEAILEFVIHVKTVSYTHLTLPTMFEV